MARSRNIKPGFFKNELLAEMLPETRLLFLGLWCLADREGRFEDRPKKIKMELFPCDDFSIEESLATLTAGGFLIRYEVGGKKYAQVVNFTKHQMPHHKEVASEIPAPPGFKQITKHAYDVTPQDRDAVFKRDGGRCLKCGATDDLSLDHITPLASGGDNSTNNLQTLCKRCNSSKGNSTKDYRCFNVESTLDQHSSNDGVACPPDSLIPDSLIPDTGFTDSKPSAQKPRLDCSPELFEEFWTNYPRRPGSSKADSLKAWKARIKEGADPQIIVEVAAKYATYCQATATEPQFIKQPATFLGPGKHYESNWTPPPRASPRMSHNDASKLSAARTIFGTEVEGTANATGRIIDITPTAAGSLGSEDFPRDAGQLRLAVPEPVENWSGR